MLGQEAVDEKSNETTAIPALLDRLAIEGALVTIDAIACNPRIARTIVEAGADYLLAVKENQPSLHAEMQSYFDDAPADEVESLTLHDKGHGTPTTYWPSSTSHLVNLDSLPWRSAPARPAASNAY